MKKSIKEQGTTNERREYTPGPWSVHEWKHNKKNKYPFYAVMGPHMIAELPIFPESEANARLIAAAPEVLRELDRLVNQLLPDLENDTKLYGDPKRLIQIRSYVETAKYTIAKATRQAESEANTGQEG